MKPDPLGVPRDPFRVFIIAWLMVNGVFLALGVGTSATLSEQLVSTSERLYGLLLFVSSGLVLAGMFWPWDPRDGLVAKAAGFLGLTFSIAIFSLATLHLWNVGGMFVGVSGLTFAGVCARSSWLAFSRMRAAARHQTMSNGGP